MLRRLIPGLVLVLVASPAAASSGGETGAFYWQVANFVLLVVVLVALLRKPMRGFFEQRRGDVGRDLDAASELLERAESRYSQWQRKLIDLDEELEKIRRDSRTRAQQEHDQIIADAHAAAERIQNDAGAAVESELRRARSDLQKEASDLAVELAEKILREQVLDSDRERLADDFIVQLERSPAAGR